MADLSCPRCASPLAAWTVRCEEGALTVEVCRSGCGGVWLDPDDQTHGGDLFAALELEASDAQPATPTESIDRSQPIACPVCRVTMRRFRWNYDSHVVLDQCREGHGTWLDGGEVEAIAEVVDGGVHPISAAERERIHARLAATRSAVRMRLRESSRPRRRRHADLDLLELIWARFL